MVCCTSGMCVLHQLGRAMPVPSTAGTNNTTNRSSLFSVARPGTGAKVATPPPPPIDHGLCSSPVMRLQSHHHHRRIARVPCPIFT